MKEHFTITSDVLSPNARVVAFKGEEALSRLYEITIDLLLPSGEEADFGDAVGGRATLHVHPEGDFDLHGIFASVELVNAASKLSLYRAVLVPAIWELSLNEHSRVFVGDTVKEIIEKIFKANAVASTDYEFRTVDTYTPLEHVCQYHESDFDFISRWMEREGLYYFFEHDGAREKLVITDASSFHKRLDKAVRYFPQTGEDASAGASLDTFKAKRRRLPQRVLLKDYDHVNPSLDVAGTAPVSPRGVGDVSVYGENFATPVAGKRLARIRAEEILAGEVVYVGEGRVYGLRTGSTFGLEDHPRPSFNTDYLLTTIRHYGNQSAIASGNQSLLELEYDEAYHVLLTCIPASVQFRAARATETPRIFGTEEAVIDAEDGHPYCEIDAHGRYKVKLKLDESDLDKGRASMWVRMLQPHGGDVEAFHFPLRKGTEVLLVFLGGNPDRPVITGAVHNAHNPSAVTQANNTKNVIQTGGQNRLEFEDIEAAQWIRLSTPPETTFLSLGAGYHNWVMSTDGRGRLRTLGDMRVDVETGKLGIIVGAGTELHMVQGRVTEIFMTGHTISVAADGRKEDVTGGYVQSVNDGYQQTIDGGDGYVQSIGPAWKCDVDGPWNFSSAKVKWEIDGEVKINCKDWNVENEGEVKWSHLGNILNTNFENKIETTMGTATEMHLGLKTEVLVGGKIEYSIAMASATFIGTTSEITVGGKTEIVLAAQSELNMGPKLDLKTMKVNVEETEAKELETKLENMTDSIKKCVNSINNIAFDLKKVDQMIIG